MKKVAALVVVLLTSIHGAVLADSSQVRATARVFATKFTVGDEIRVLLETEAPRNYQIEPPSDKTDLAPFELKRVEESPVIRGKNRVKRTYVLIVAAFEKGTLTFPAVGVDYQTAEGKRGQVRSEPIQIEIASVGRRPTDQDDIRGIKGPESFGKAWLWKWIGWVLIFALSLFLAVRFWVAVRRKSVDDESLKPPHIRARLELDRLKNSHVTAAGLADILRRYLERRVGVEAMEKTTQELSESMKSKGLDRSLIDRVRVFLERADLAKFAKQEPAPKELETTESELLKIVDDTTPKETEIKTKPA